VECSFMVGQSWSQAAEYLSNVSFFVCSCGERVSNFRQWETRQ